ncbi:MAG: hypothetical protein HXY21_09925 [Parvularculaceae bacterium]|nr:hypothetical protein [Parvularculaceae bacterium]
MGKSLLILIAAAQLAAGEAFAAEPRGDYAPFDVARSAPRRVHELAAFEIAGAPVALNAYGRKARARRYEVVRETREDRLHAAAFDRAARPPLLTLEMRVSF